MKLSENVSLGCYAEGISIKIVSNFHYFDPL